MARRKKFDIHAVVERALKDGTATETTVNRSLLAAPSFAVPLEHVRTEAEFQDRVIVLARSLGWAVAHFRPLRTADGWETPVAADGKGWFDLALARERLVFIELKVEPNKMTREQEAWAERYSKAGAEWYCFYPADWDELAAVLKRGGPG